MLTAEVARTKGNTIPGRITPRQAIEGYMKTGFAPTRHIFLDTVFEEACPLTAIALAPTNGEPADYHDIVSKLQALGYGSEYRIGFTRGFDGEDSPVSAGDNDITNERRNGWRDGRRVARFVLP